MLPLKSMGESLTKVRMCWVISKWLKYLSGQKLLQPDCLCPRWLYFHLEGSMLTKNVLVTGILCVVCPEAKMGTAWPPLHSSGSWYSDLTSLPPWTLGPWRTRCLAFWHDELHLSSLEIAPWVTLTRCFFFFKVYIHVGFELTLRLTKHTLIF